MYRAVSYTHLGQGEKSAVQEIYENYGIKTYPIVTVREIIETLYNTPVDGKIYIDDVMKDKIDVYKRQGRYCIRPFREKI